MENKFSYSIHWKWHVVQMSIHFVVLFCSSSLLLLPFQALLPCVFMSLLSIIEWGRRCQSSAEAQHSAARERRSTLSKPKKESRGWSRFHKEERKRIYLRRKMLNSMCSREVIRTNERRERYVVAGVNEHEEIDMGIFFTLASSTIRLSFEQHRQSINI